jgi:hypothetical protein
MVSITSAARANLLQLIGANSEQDKVGSQLITGKRVQSVSDNAFSFFQGRGLDNRIQTLSTINDRIAIGTRATEQAAASGKKITSNLNTVKGLLDDIKSKGAAGNQETSTITGSTGATGSIFNRVGSANNQINRSTLLADTADLGAGSVFAKAGKTADSLIADVGTSVTQNVGEATSILQTAATGTTSIIGARGNFFVAGDVISITIGGKDLNLVARASFTGSGGVQLGTGADAANALEVTNINDIVNAINGKKADGTTALAASETFGDVASASYVAAGGLKLTSLANAVITLQGSTVADAGAASQVFGGTAGALSGTTATTTLIGGSNPLNFNIGSSNSVFSTSTAGSASLISTGGFTANDTVRTQANGKSLFVRVVAAFTGAGATQAGTGADAANALEVRTIDDYQAALNGKKVDGTNLTTAQTLGVTATFDGNANGAAKFKVNSGSDLSFQVSRTGVATTLASQIFGGRGNLAPTADTSLTTFSNVTTNAGDIYAVNVGGKSIFAKVVTGNFTGVGQTQAGTGLTETDAIEVRTLGDLANAFSGKKADGINDLSTNFKFNQPFAVSVDAGSAGSKLRVSSAASAAFAVKKAGATAFNVAAAGALFGGQQTGTAGTTDFGNTALGGGLLANNISNTLTTTLGAAAQAGGFVLGDIVSFDVGPANNKQTLALKIVQNFTGAVVNGQATQKGNGQTGQQGNVDGPLEVRNIGDMVNALRGLNSAGQALADFSWNNLGVTASFDDSTAGGTATTPRFSFAAGAAMKVNVTRANAVAGLAGAIFGSPTGSTSVLTPGVDGNGPGSLNTSTLTVGSVVNNAAKEARLSAARGYQTALNSLRGLVDDAQVNGINLLKDPNGFTAVLSETVTTRFTLRSTLGNGSTDPVVNNPLTILGFPTDATGNATVPDFSTNAQVDTSLTIIENALNSLAGRDSELEVIKAVLAERQSFNTDIVTSLGDLSNDLTAVNQEEASAQAQAASFSSNAALKFLGVSSQRAQQLLQIF